jgi:hypothetical protein
MGSGPSILDEEAIGKFRAGLRGALLCAGDDGFDGARKLWNGMIDKRPALIVLPTADFTKNTYDPTNFFRMNLNVKPTV